MRNRMAYALLAAATSLAVLCTGCGGSAQLATTAPMTTTTWATTETTTWVPEETWATTTTTTTTREWATEAMTEAMKEATTEAWEMETTTTTTAPAPMADGDQAFPGAKKPQENNEKYLEIVENSEVPVSSQSMFTFSMKVDTASYNNVQRYIEGGALPPADAVKIEEMVNYFSYFGEPQFNDGDPFAISAEIGPSPFDAGKYLAFVRVKARDIDRSKLPPLNLTFLIDTSGSMESFDKLPLLKTSFGMLTDMLTENDKVSIVTYAGSSMVLLDSVSGADKARIIGAIDSLSASGSTAGADGINTAYRLAEKNYRADGNNRIILATDGDFNVGVSSMSGLEALVADKRDSGIYLSILGFGIGNLRDDTMETLAKHGNGNASYINSVAAAKKVLVDELSSNLFVIAADVKAQVELNPDNVKSYRLMGYENRALENKDFSDDTKDAGEIGVGSDVVMLFEFELNGSGNGGPEELKYASVGRPEPASRLSAWYSSGEGSNYPDELFEIRLRYKIPGESESRLMLHPVGVGQLGARDNSDDFRFASAVAGFGHLLRNSRYLGGLTIDAIIAQAQGSLGGDPQGYRYEFVKLLREYKSIR